jgi:DNA polymerase-3 subunit gamma/tau
VSYQVIARKWRPQRFDDVVGQNHVVKTLQNAIAGGRIAHAFLFAGQRGIGKTSIARILARALNCEQGPTPTPCGTCPSCREITEGSTMDVLEIDGASNTGVNDVRELRESVKYVPAHGRYKIYIIDEVHMLSTPAFNALLKTLEEPPPHVIFMFATTEVHKIPSTVLSRCQRFDLRRISLEALVAHLRYIAAGEGITVSEKGLRWIARDAEGSMRDAQSILDRVISYAGKEVSDKDIIEIVGMVDRDLLLRASQAIVSKDAQTCLSVAKDLFQCGSDVRQFYHAFLEQLRNMIMVKVSENPSRLLDLPPDECTELAEQVKGCELETLQRLFDIWLKGEEDLYRSSMPQIILEMLLLKMVYSRRLLPVDDALAKLADIERRIACPAGAGEPPADAAVKFRGDNDEVRRGRDAPAAAPAQRGAAAEQSRSWPGFLAYAKREKPMLAALLDHGCLVALDEKKLEVGFAPDSIFLESARDADKISQLKKLSEAFFGRPLRVAVSVLDNDALPPSPEPVPQDEGAAVQVEEQPPQDKALLHEALSLFDATIVEVKAEEGSREEVGKRQKSTARKNKPMQ